MRQRSTPFYQRPFFLMLLAVLMIAGGYYYWPEGNLTQASQQAQGAMPVEVMAIESQKLRLWNEFSGQLEAIDSVQVRPRVGGIITQVLFDEGASVAKGDPLFVIDPRPFEAEVASAKATLASARSQAELARVEFNRSKKLVKNQFVSESVHDQRQRDYQVARAAVKAAEAALKQAQLDLEFAHIKAPISGQVSRAEITVGNVVEAGVNAPVLTTVVSEGAIFGEFDVDEQTYLRAKRTQALGTNMPVEMTLAGDTETTYRGEIHSFDNRLNTTSGTVRARALFKNSDNTLIPGMFATIRLGGASKQSVLLVDNKAISTDQAKKYVYKVSADNEVAYQQISLGQMIGQKRVVTSGLEDGDRVLVNSLQKVRPGMKIDPQLQAADSDQRGVIVGEAENQKQGS